MRKKPLGVYIHVPFCLKKCNYCDFFSHKPKYEGEIEEYFSGLCSEIRRAENEDICCNAADYIVDTVFIGGGTPSMVSPAFIRDVLSAIRDTFELAENAEITLEANPETVTAENLAEYKAMGINRISIGIQSLNDDVLRIMGRVHDADKARQAISLVKDAGFNFNCDLIFGAPGQSFEIFKESLDEILSFGPDHVSFYSLQIEECTPFYIDYRFGKLDIPSWEENRRMYHYAADTLKSFGYHHYEVSNAAKPGRECRHNLKYWTMQEYIGFGKAAHSFVGGVRTDESEPDLKTDFLFTELRLIDGFAKIDYLRRFGSAIEEDYGTVLKELENEDLIAQNADTVRFTTKGLDCTNIVLERLINY